MSCWEIFRCIVCLAEFATAKDLADHKCPVNGTGGEP